LAFGDCLASGVGNRGCDESCDDESIADSTSASGSGTDGRFGSRGVAVARGGGTGDEAEGEGQTPAGSVYEHWYVERPPRVRSSRMAAKKIWRQI
jgi:hypothetical protein